WSLVEQVLGEAGRARVFQVALGGGEPLLHPRILDIVRSAREHNLVPNLTTNGNLLDRELALALNEAGVGQVQISLNGSDEKTNRRTRPNFAAAMRAIENCRTVGLRFGINFLLTRSSLLEVARMIELSRSLGAASVNILRPKPPVAAADDGWLERESPDSEGYRAVRRILTRLRDRDSPTRITLDASLTFLLTGGSPEQLYRSGIWGCSAARRFVTIGQDGAVYPCSHVRWSDVDGGEFIRAWWKSKVFARFRSLEGKLRGPCRSCPYVSFCKGCRAVVMAFGGTFADSDPHCPHGREKLLEEVEV
ncbi:MAG: radical SAM/SPASM domain-containing protein, partial [Candidatus Bipolaricaulia bacterium]